MGRRRARAGVRARGGGLILRRIGLLGGSFDPPHRAHRALGEAAQRTLALDELRWLPAGAPWQKAGQAMTAPVHRCRMLALLLDEGGPRPAGWVIDDRELQRDGPTYTLDTVRELQAEHAAAGHPPAEWWLVIGQDQLARFDTWHGWRELLQRLTLAVAGRAGVPPEPSPALQAAGLRWQPLDLPPMAVAARDIRAAVARGEPVAAWVGDAVAGYIDRERLYRAPPERPA